MALVLFNPPVDYTYSYVNNQGAHKSWLAKIMGTGHGLVPGLVPPMGLLYTAAVAKEAGINTVFIEGSSLKSDEECLNSILQKNPVLVGISCTGYNWPNVQALAKQIKEKNKDVKVIIGGAFPEGYRRKCLDECKDIDYVATGDGEPQIRDLYLAISADKDKGEKRLSTIPGLIWRNKKGEIKVNEGMSMVKDLNAIPFPAREIININEYTPSIGYFKRLPNITVIGSRGCPYRCTFCHTTNDYGNKLRLRTAKNIVDEIEDCVKKYGIKDVIFWDNVLTINKTLIKEICAEILNRKIDITWCGSTRADLVDYETLVLMKKAGCWRLLFGIESGVQRNLDTIKKNTVVEKVKEGLAACHKAGIESLCTFIFGLPGETYEDGLQTIEFACTQPISYAKFFSLGVHPGTPLYDNIDQYGVLQNFQEAQTQQAVGFVPHTMTKEQIEELISLAYKRFYKRPSYILGRALKMRTFQDLRQNVRGFLAFCMNKQEITE